MIGAQQVVDIALAEARVGKADETMVLVTDRADAALRWAGNSMTTNGESVSRNTTVISIVRRGDSAHVGSVRSSEVDPSAIPDLVAASQEAALSAPEARDSAPPLPGTDVRPDWDARFPAPASRCSPAWRGAGAGLRGADQLYGYARHIVETTFVATSNGLRRRYTQPTGSVEINAKRDGASAWAGISTPDFVDVPTDSMLDELSTRLGWARRTVELPAGRYETIMPPSTVADMMIYLAWSMDGRGAQEGRTALSAPGRHPGGGEAHRSAADAVLGSRGGGLECAPFVAVPSSSERCRCSTTAWTSAGWTGSATARSTRWLSAGGGRRVRRTGRGARRQPADDRRLGEPGRHDREHRAGPAADHAVVHPQVDPTVLLLTGLTRDGVYLVEDGEVTAAVNNFRFNESPLDLLRRATEAGVSEVTLPREWGDWATRAAMPSLRIPDFHMSSVSQAQ